MARDTIRLEDLEVRCIIGVNPDERDREQPLQISAELELDLARAGMSARLDDTCDYDRVADEIAALLKFRRYRLLEAAAEEVSAMLLGVHPQLSAVRLRIDKPEALRGRARSAGVSTTRRQQDYPRRWETARFGAVEIVLETPEAGLYLLHVEPGESLAAHRRERRRELEFHVRGELSRSGVRLVGLSPTECPFGQVSEYVNHGPATATVFRCDQPRVVPKGELLEGVA